MKNSTSMERISSSTSNNSISSTSSGGGGETKTILNYNTLKAESRKIGYIKKLGGSGISKNWKKRFFILTNSGMLYYFKHRTSSEYSGVIDLAEYTKIYKDKSKKKYFLLVNENNPSIRVFHLIADSQDDMDKWISEITEFFEDDIMDLKNQLSNITKLKVEKQQNYYDTITKNAIKSKRVEEYDLEKLQLVFKGERLSLLVKDPLSLSISQNTLLNDINFNDIKLNEHDNGEINNNNNNNKDDSTNTITTTTTTTTTTTISPRPSPPPRKDINIDNQQQQQQPQQ